MTESNALEGVVDVALDLVAPLASAVQDEASLIALLNQIGWSAPGVDPAVLRDAVDALEASIEALRTGMSFESLDSLVATLGSLVSAIEALSDFATTLAAASPDVAAVGDLVVDLLQHLSLLYVGRWPVLYAVFELLGLIDERPVTALSIGAVMSRAPVMKPVLAFDALGSLLSDPVAHLKNRYGAERLVSVEVAERVTQDLFDPILQLVVMAGGSGVVGTGGVDTGDPLDAEARRQATLIVALPTGEVASQLSLVTDLVPTGSTSRTGDAGPGFLLSPEGALSVAVTLEGSEFTLSLEGGAFSAWFPADGSPVVHGPASGATLLLAWRKLPPTEGAPALAFGSDTLAVTVSGLSASVKGRFGRPDDPDLHLEIESAVDDARFALMPGEGDGFLAKVLPSDGITFEFDFGLGYSNRRGVYFSGSASVEADFPLHVSLLGILTIEVLSLSLGASTDGGVKLGAGATVTLTLGPLTATVQRMGLSAQATFPAEGGNLGPLQVSPAFLPPRGVGMVIDAGPVKGGGYILNDYEHGRYAGILELDIADVVAVKAIGLITVQEPTGFSLLVIITAEFPPIQLGFGFSLSGLGGLLGLNRTMNLPALRDGARTGVLDSILFPVDPVARAAKVISDVETVFPVAPGRFVVGLMARLGWGSPQIVVVDLGVIVELPAPVRIVLLGRLGVVLPDPDAAVVELHLDIVGILDLGRGELSIDATLHDSRIAVFEIYGDMALRVGWGANPAFAISVGGFNPRFERPAGFPELRRMTIALATGDNPRIRLESYLATTANSFQTGARLDAHVELDTGVLGLFSADAYLGFDALIIFNPFQFIVDLSGGIVIKRNGAPFIGALLQLTLYGPQPLRATGFAEVQFFGTHRIPIDVTVGDDPASVVLALIDPAGALLRALLDPQSWTTELPAGAPVAANTSPAALTVHPRGGLVVRQKVVPLGLTIERFGGSPLSGGPQAYRATFRIGTAVVTGSELRDAWAPGDLFSLSDDEKLSRPAFEQLVSGSSGLGAPPPTRGAAVSSAPAGYETSVIDAADPVPRPVAAHTVPADLKAVFMAGAIVTSGYSAPSMKVAVGSTPYAVVSTDTLVATGEHPSYVEAMAAAGGSQVVAAHEAVRP